MTTEEREAFKEECARVEGQIKARMARLDAMEDDLCDDCYLAETRSITSLTEEWTAKLKLITAELERTAAEMKAARTLLLGECEQLEWEARQWEHAEEI